MALKVQTLFIDDLDGSIGDPCTGRAADQRVTLVGLLATESAIGSLMLWNASRAA